MTHPYDGACPPTAKQLEAYNDDWTVDRREELAEARRIMAEEDMPDDPNPGCLCYGCTHPEDEVEESQATEPPYDFPENRPIPMLVQSIIDRQNARSAERRAERMSNPRVPEHLLERSKQTSIPEHLLRRAAASKAQADERAAAIKDGRAAHERLEELMERYPTATIETLDAGLKVAVPTEDVIPDWSNVWANIPDMDGPRFVQPRCENCNYQTADLVERKFTRMSNAWPEESTRWLCPLCIAARFDGTPGFKNPLVADIAAMLNVAIDTICDEMNGLELDVDITEERQLTREQMLDAEPPNPMAMIAQLHRAVFGDVWARPDTPKAVWEMLIDTVTRECKALGLHNR